MTFSDEQVERWARVLNEAELAVQRKFAPIQALPWDELTPWYKGILRASARAVAEAVLADQARDVERLRRIEAASVAMANRVEFRHHSARFDVDDMVDDLCALWKALRSLSPPTGEAAESTKKGV